MAAFDKLEGRSERGGKKRDEMRSERIDSKGKDKWNEDSREERRTSVFYCLPILYEFATTDAYLCVS